MFALLAIVVALPNCVIRDGGGSDAIANTLTAAAECPTDVFAFRDLLSAHGYTFTTTLVANRGFHNPSEGSFSLFEIVRGNGLAEGDAFFGHFIVKDGERLVAEQNPSPNALMIEAFAFDAAKHAFNFYELRGDGTRGVWFYRGDSHDIAADVAQLHRAEAPKFGTRLRCSGCHVNGAAIMKELAMPHNDWWTRSRGLDFGGRTFEPRLQEIVKSLADPTALASATRASLKRLEPREDLRTRARPLFCPMEVNLESDTARDGAVTLPAGFFVDPRLASGTITIERARYEAVLKRTATRFPETKERDADHAWLAPVKAHSDIAAIDALIASGELTEELVLDVLAIDMTNPLFSEERCAWLDRDWSKIPHKTPAQHRADAAAYLSACNTVDVDAAYSVLMQRRNELRASVISRNPKGQILEPGFRVIFPESAGAPKPGTLRFDQQCRVRKSVSRQSARTER